jgi:hypothetical protein
MFDLFNLANNDGKQVKIGGKTFGSQEQVIEEVKTESTPAVKVPLESPADAITTEDKQVSSDVQSDAAAIAETAPSTTDENVVNDTENLTHTPSTTATEEQPAAELAEPFTGEVQAPEEVDVTSIFGNLQKQMQDAQAKNEKETNKKKRRR